MDEDMVERQDPGHVALDEVGTDRPSAAGMLSGGVLEEIEQGDHLDETPVIGLVGVDRVLFEEDEFVHQTSRLSSERSRSICSRGCSEKMEARRTPPAGAPTYFERATTTPRSKSSALDPLHILGGLQGPSDDRDRVVVRLEAELSARSSPGPRCAGGVRAAAALA